jgi:hypothetical protein
MDTTCVPGYTDLCGLSRLAVYRTRTLRHGTLRAISFDDDGQTAEDL